VLSVWVQEGKKLPGVDLVKARPWIPWGLAAAAWLTACYAGRDGGRSSYQYTDLQFFAEHVIYTPFVFLLLLPAVFGDDRRDWIRRFLGWKPIAFVGMISYSFYLYHFAVLVFQARRWSEQGWGTVPDGGLEWIAWLVPPYRATVVVGAIGFDVIAKPFIKLKYRGGSRQQADPIDAEQITTPPHETPTTIAFLLSTRARKASMTPAVAPTVAARIGCRNGPPARTLPSRA
jgi:peptidoglycan/LPS O-acetylase OafA/YrhL